MPTSLFIDRIFVAEEEFDDIAALVEQVDEIPDGEWLLQGGWFVPQRY